MIGWFNPWDRIIVLSGGIQEWEKLRNGKKLLFGRDPVWGLYTYDDKVEYTDRLEMVLYREDYYYVVIWRYWLTFNNRVEPPECQIILEDLYEVDDARFRDLMIKAECRNLWSEDEKKEMVGLLQEYFPAFRDKYFNLVRWSR